MSSWDNLPLLLVDNDGRVYAPLFWSSTAQKKCEKNGLICLFPSEDGLREYPDIPYLTICGLLLLFELFMPAGNNRENNHARWANELRLDA